MTIAASRDPIGRFIHDPDATLDYSIDWSRWLAEGETVTASAWEVPSDLENENDDNAAGIATVWVSGGTAGTEYRLTNHITTSAGRTDDRSIALVVQDR